MEQKSAFGKIRKEKIKSVTAGLLCLFLLAVLFIPAGKVLAEETTGDRVRIGYYSSRDFQEGDGETSARSGYGYEYIQKIASYTGWRYEYVSGDWAELYQMLQRGEIDMMAGIAYAEDRKDEIFYPDYQMLEQTFYIYKDMDDTSMLTGELESYEGRHIGAVDGERAQEFLEAWEQEKQTGMDIISYRSIEECADAFNRHELDGFVSSDNVVSASSYSGVTPVEMIGREPYYLCVARDRKDLLEELNTALYVMNTQDTLYLENLRNKYTADSSISVFVSRQEIEWMEEHPSVVVGYMSNFLPYSDTDAKGEVTGLVKDVLPALFSVLPGSYQPEISYRSFSGQEEMLAALKSGEVDMIFPVGGEIPYAEEQGYQQSTAVLNVSADLMYKGEYSDSTTERIAVNQANSLQSYYTRMHYPDSELIYYDGIGACIDAVKRGDAGCTVMNALRVVKFIGEDTEFNIFPLADTEDVCFGVDFGNTALLRLLNHGLSILGDGYGLNHAYQYINSLISYTAGDFIRDYWWVFFAVIIAVFGCAIWVLITRYRMVRATSEQEAEHNRHLKEALKREQEAGYAKQIFLNNISHDIRTPLNGLLGIIEINGKGISAEEAAKNRQKAKKSIYQLLDLINNVIEMSKLETDSLPVSEEPVDLLCLMEEVRIAAQAKAEDAGLGFRYEHAGVREWPMLYGNAAYIREVLQHILANAVKYNRPGGRVEWQAILKADPEQERHFRYECIISDTGVGMEAEFLQHIFEPFTQERSDARTVYRGAGLGMSIVKSLIDRMNGEIHITSHAGEGTRVHIMLPMIAVEDTKTEEPPLEADSDISGMHILLVDDNELNLEIARFMLEEAGAVVTVARNGKQAVETYLYADPGAFDAVLMDIMMPVMDGYEATRQIRTSGQRDAEEIPILAVTACVLDEVRKEGENVGMNGYLEKPLDMDTLVKMLADCRHR